MASLPEVSTTVYDALEPLSSEDRRKVIRAALSLLGESSDGVLKAASQARDATEQDGLPLGPKARRWMQQNGLTESELESVFHFNNGEVEIIATDVDGDSKLAKSKSCYLLTGIQSLLKNDDATFQDKDAVELCGHMRCYDSANNATARKKIGLGGSKQNGFALTAPCLREAAETIKKMANK